jgi:hypothetical protein
MMKLLTVSLSALSLWSYAGAFAADMKAECPVGLPSKTIKPGEPVPGWVTTTEQMHLDAAGMLTGAPETELYIMPAEGTKERPVFKFDKGDGQRWLWCGYGGVQLSRRLDDKATRCVLTFKTQRRDGAPTL